MEIIPLDGSQNPSCDILDNTIYYKLLKYLAFEEKFVAVLQVC
jgi:hypothetical protein